MRLKRVLILLPLLLVAAAAATLVWLFAGLPSTSLDTSLLPQPSVRITDSSGRLLYESLPAETGRHSALPLARIPLIVQQATIATEDSSFYQNPGIDLAGVLRAAWINLTGGETIAGGSTITQQVARNMLMTEEERSERSLKRKLREAVLAWSVTQKYSKAQILELYLNQTYYGGLSYGIEAAAQTYFGKSVADLDLAEAALLAGLPQAPAAYNPYSHPADALARRSTVLGLMQKAGFISAEQRQQADREPLELSDAPYPMNAPHFALMVRDEVDALLTQEQIRAAGGVTVKTTLDLDAQHKAEQAIAQQLEKLKVKGQNGLGYNVNNAALVALDPRSGAILAMVGSADYGNQAIHGAINMALAPRQPGSALKPFIYALAFDPTRPRPWTAATMILDVSTHFVTHDGKPYTPKDYDGEEHGPVLARQALASSLNIPAVLTLQNVGLPTLFELARSAGMNSFGDPDNYDLSLALGGGEVRLLDLTAGYGMFATGGMKVTPYAIQEITGADGSLLYRQTPPDPVRILDERVAWLITDILSDDQARLIGFQAHSALNLDRPAAVKTGTTTNWHDNWTVGYTPSLVVGVWVGNAGHEAMREVNGLTGAAPIWHEVMRGLLTDQPVEAFERPAGLKQVEVCALSGLLPTPACPYRRKEWFIDGTEPTRADTLYQTVQIDSATGLEAGPSTPPERIKTIVALNLPPQALPWARSHGLTVLADLQSSAGGPAQAGMTAAAQPSHADLLVTSPAPQATFIISKSIPLDSQRIPIEAAGVEGLTSVTLWMDGQPLASFDHAPYRTFWQLAPGSHTVWATAKTASGRQIASIPVIFQVESSRPQ